MAPALDSLSTEIILLIVETFDSLTTLRHLRATCRYFRYLPTQLPYTLHGFCQHRDRGTGIHQLTACVG